MSMESTIKWANLKIVEQAKELGIQKGEITRLLAIEAAAKEIVGNCWRARDNNFWECKNCKLSHRPLIINAPDKTKHKPDCPIRVINPIGDK